MYDSVDQWRDGCRAVMARYVALRRQIDDLEATAAAQLALVVDTYAWPKELPVPDRLDAFRCEQISGTDYGEDLTSELAIAGGTSVGAARYLVRDVAHLTQRLPHCWDKVVTTQAPLWQARRVAEACQGLDVGCWAEVDAQVATSLGAVGMGRLARLITAGVATAAPATMLRRSEEPVHCVRTGGDPIDPLTGWVWAKVERSDAIFLDATIQLIADKLAQQGDPGTPDQLRARALGVLANPAAALQITGIHTTRGMNPTPETDADREAICDAAGKLLDSFTPRSHIYVHTWIDHVDDPLAVARVEGIGPVLTSQIALLTGATKISVTPVIHVGADSITSDAYEIPHRIREHVLMRDPWEPFPWSNRESRGLDLDHTIPWQPGLADQTRPGNLEPLTRKTHRVKTHADWQLTQTLPGQYTWHTHARQHIITDHTGSRRE